MLETDRNWLRRFRRNVTRWYGQHARDLPWRRSGDPYRIWISEIMLQQTTVAAVIPYFERFLNRFPTLTKLAAAPENEVLRHWEGLGYYSRARNLHKTAKRLVNKGDARLPNDPAELIGLPGIGRYTAGAIASCAFDVRAPILEANTSRLYSRLVAFRGDPKSTAGQTQLWEFAERILPTKSPGQFNQALMDIGATVCTPEDPKCKPCPVRSCCQAFAENAQSEIPVAKKRPQIKQLTEATVAVWKNGSLLLRQRQAGEWWAGLWDFPRFRLDNSPSSKKGKRRGRGNGSATVDPRLATELCTAVADQTGINAAGHEFLTELRHTVTHHRIRLLCFSASYQGGRLKVGRHQQWVPVASLAGYPLSTTGREVANLVGNAQP